MLLEYHCYYYSCYGLWVERGGEREVSLSLHCKNEHVNYSCDEYALSALSYCSFVFQLPMACNTTTEHSVIIVVGKKYSPSNATCFSFLLLHFRLLLAIFPLWLFEFNRIYSKKKKKGNQNSTVPLKQMRGKSVIPNVIKEKQNKNRVGRWCMRCIYRGWQLDAYTHWTLSNCVCASLPQQKKKNKNKTKERKFLTSSFVYSFFLNESLRQLKPAFLYLILFISTYK